MATESGHDIPDTNAYMGDSAADRVFHILEIAQLIVCELELKDLFRALPITRDLWETRDKIPDRVWAHHLRRLGYPDYVIRDTSYCLRTSYISIAQAVDGISRGVRPKSERIITEDYGKGKYIHLSCEGNMEPPLMFLSFNSGIRWNLRGNMYTLDGIVLKLLTTRGEEPFHRICDGNSVLISGPNRSFEARRLKDWSLTARFENFNLPDGTEIERYFLFNDKHMVSMYDSPVEERDAEGDNGDRVVHHTMVEFWDFDGQKRGESVLHGVLHSEMSLSSINGCQYFTVTSSSSQATSWSRATSWSLDTLDIVFERSLSTEEKRKGYTLKLFGDVLNLLSSSGESLGHWLVDGGETSVEVAEMLRHCAYYPIRKFSDGHRVSWSRRHPVLWDKEGKPIKGFLWQDDEIRRRGLIPCANRFFGFPTTEEMTSARSVKWTAGILFDRFFFIISFLPNSWIAAFRQPLLVVYSKKGVALTSRLLHSDMRGMDLTWFIDILGRLVIIYHRFSGMTDEWEVIDFRGNLSESGKKAANFQESQSPRVIEN
ncbi:hypothetical protein FPSE_12106 [Fusarium pseudograminearum CS3096]|uniref:Uncharacterized protein n=1 Tax=Fusarium pseudograminearum (strain CS3096) TaxID=1028729 RepID=K3VWR0_FUSPC|nr:hypothetical protein FPSE_12106 [Fusarium pseudograminearum CS3096]EKJ67735.1 hypothetical protein FPSE_12106 [Fusarium pseudograminearum CS3096]